MESHTLELYPNRGQIHIALFRNVTNAADLRKRLIAQDPTLSCALVEASVVTNKERECERESSLLHTFHVVLHAAGKTNVGYQHVPCLASSNTRGARRAT